MNRNPEISQSSLSCERRQSPRAALDTLANRFQAGYPRLCRTIDISATGMCVTRVADPLCGPDNRFTGLQFQLPGVAATLSASAEIVATDGEQLRLRFTSMPPETEKHLHAFLRHKGLLS